MRKLLFILLIILIFTIPIAYAEDCQVSKIKTNLKKALYEYYNSPAAARLALGNIKDLLNFYLAIPQGQSTVNCDGIGQYSGEVFSRIIQDANNITTTIPKCSDGTEFGECSTSKPKYCYNGNLVNKCSVCRCTSGSCLSTESCSFSQPVQNQTQPPTCTDSDGGKIYHIKGTTIGFSGSLTDSCNSLDGINPLNGNYPATAVIERYCGIGPSGNPDRLSLYYDCGATGCQDGACNVQATCTNECSSGLLSCSGSYARTCGNYDTDSCLEWNTGTLCQNGCMNGFCNAGNQTAPVCGNTWCESGESCSSCANDCGGCSFQHIQITNSFSYKIYPNIYGNNIVWDNNTRVFKYDLLTGQEVLMSPSIGKNADIYDNLIVWQDGRFTNFDIYMYNLSNGQERRITSNSADQKFPIIYKDKIAYIDYRHNSNGDIYLYDLSSNTEKRITLGPSMRGRSRDVSLYENKIVWTDYIGGESNYDLFVHDLTTQMQTKITNFPSYKTHPKIYGNKIVWSDARHSISSNSPSGSNYAMDIYLYDLSTGIETRVTNNPSGKWDLDMYNDIVVWQGTVPSAGAIRDVFIYNLITGQETKITSSSSIDIMPKLYENKLVWVKRIESAYDIYMTTIN